MAITDDRLVHGIVGAAIGDALGLPVHGKTKAELDATPVASMLGYGTYNQPAGNYSDETALNLASLDALSKGLDLTAILNNYKAWYTDNVYAPYETAHVDIWPATEEAVTDKPLTDTTKDPGGLTRVLPFAYFLYHQYGTTLFTNDAAFKQLRDFLAITNPDIENLIAGAVYAQIVTNLLDGQNLKDAITAGLASADTYFTANQQAAWQRFRETEVSADNPNADPFAILTLALADLQNTNDYREAALAAVNRGGYTDTLGSLVGGLAGIAYGYQALPHKWCLVLAEYSEIVDLCEQAEASDFFTNYAQD